MSFYRVGTAARLSGVQVGTLRNWEARYGLVVPARTSGGQRLYSVDSVDDIERLTTLRTLIDQGLSAGEAHNVLRARPVGQSSTVQGSLVRADARRVRREVAEAHARAAAEYERECERLSELLRYASGARARSLRLQAENARVAAERRRKLAHPV